MIFYKTKKNPFKTLEEILAYSSILVSRVHQYPLLLFSLSYFQIVKPSCFFDKAGLVRVKANLAFTLFYFSRQQLFQAIR